MEGGGGVLQTEPGVLLKDPGFPLKDPGLKDPRVLLKAPRDPFKGPRCPFKGPRDPFKGPRGPFKGPRDPFKGPRGPFEGPRDPFDYRRLSVRCVDDLCVFYHRCLSRVPLSGLRNTMRRLKNVNKEAKLSQQRIAGPSRNKNNMMTDRSVKPLSGQMFAKPRLLAKGSLH